MCGLSGSGKSYLARRLVPRVGAVRLRSDVARKAQGGLAPGDPAANDVGEGLYSARRSDAVYDWLGRIAGDLLASGEHVIVDATFLDADRREAFRALAQQAGSDARVLFCAAPLETLRARIRAREAAADDPSDAGLEVLEHQRRGFVEPGPEAVRVDTASALTGAALDALARRLGGAGTDGVG